MSLIVKFLVAIAVLAPSAGYCVGAVVDANVFYFNDTFVYGEEDATTFNRLLWDFFVGMGLNRKNSYVVGWSYGSMTFDDNPGIATKLTVSDMGPKFMVYFDKERFWVLGFTYNLITKASYSEEGSSAIELRGSSMKVEVGYTPAITETILFGVKLNYYKASFAEKVIDESITKEANSRTAIYPSLSFTMRWD